MSNTMCARAVLTCRPNSHPFQDRTLPLDQPIKIGRSVARARPSPNNAIFDCKVLSRNHALLWYETENGKFYLQDTKSSNGTFVNNQRLSKSSEESTPRELCSGDIVQFGVDVMEVNKKCTVNTLLNVTHGCIIANVQLFLPDGKEAKASSSTIVPEKATSTPVQDIYLLNQYLKEAMLREQVLENKLAIMTKHLAGTKEFMEENWKALIEEDRLLTRVDILERQLQASHKSMTEDKLREEVVQLLQDKEKYQNTAKEALRKAMQEKLEVSKKFKDTERNLQELEGQKGSLEEMCERNFKELKELAEKYEQAEQNKKELTEELNLSTQKYKEELDSLNLKIKEKEDVLKEKKLLIQELVTKMDSKVAKSILFAHNEDPAELLPPTKDKDANNIIRVDDNNSPTNESKDSDDHHNNDLNNEQNNSNKSALLEEKCDKNHKELKELAEKYEQAEQIKKELTEEMNLSTQKYKEELESLNLKIKEKEDVLKEKKQLIKELVTKMDSTIAKSILYAHNEDAAELLSISHQSNIIKVDSPSTESKDGDHNNTLHHQDLNDNKLRDVGGGGGGVEFGTNNGISRPNNNSDVDSNNSSYNNGLQNRMIELEEELAEFKDRYNECSSNCTILSQKYAQLNEDHEALLSQSAKSNEVAECPTSNDISPRPKNNDLDLNSSSSSYNNGLQNRMIELEEELAVYKDRYNECSSNCTNVSRKFAELNEEHQALLSHSKSVNLLVVIPVIILVLAILIALRPTS